MKVMFRRVNAFIPLFILLTTAEIASAFYDPTVQRWINRDPIGEAGFEVLRGLSGTPHIGDRNRHRFVSNDPINNADYFGLDTVPSGTCADAPALKNDSPDCDKYGDKTYLGASLKCFCKCAPNDDWSQKVRGCLRCMSEKGYPDKDAHKHCYALADQQYKGKKPNSALAKCWTLCLPCEVPEGWPPSY